MVLPVIGGDFCSLIAGALSGHSACSQQRTGRSHTLCAPRRDLSLVNAFALTRHWTSDRLRESDARLYLISPLLPR